jgi:hypothetical protein
MTNPDNAISLIKYLQREQYGSVPLVSGPDYNSKPTGMKDGKMQYWKGDTKYEELGEKKDAYTYNSEDTRLFPRIWDGNDQNHAKYYQNYLGLEEDEKPSSFDNLKFFYNYQVKQMWWRYFCWNYIGRENDIQNIQGEPENGNWLSGIKPIDKIWMGDVDKMPKGVRDSPALTLKSQLILVFNVIFCLFPWVKLQPFHITVCPYNVFIGAKSHLSSSLSAQIVFSL